MNNFHNRAAISRCSRVAVVMAITKCRIWVPLVNQFTVTERALRQCGRTSDDWHIA